MVAENPLFQGRWTWKKFEATVIDDIWPGVASFTFIATMVTLTSKWTDHKLGVSHQLLTVLGLVLGLVISFRTSSAYERYQDGRKMWSNIMVATKNLAQMIWIHVPNHRPVSPDSKGLTELQCIIEKKSMINLLHAYAVSVKHLLRAEQGVYYEDLYPLISFLPRYANLPTGVISGPEDERLPLWHFRDGHDSEHLSKTPVEERDHLGVPVAIPKAEPNVYSRPFPAQEKILVNESPSLSSSIQGRKLFPPPPRRPGTFDPEAALPQLPSEIPLKPAKNPPVFTMYDYFPLLRLLRWIGRTSKCISKPKEEQKKRRAYSHTVESQVHIELSLVLHSYLAYLLKKGLLQPAIATGMTNNLTLLQDTVSNLERICNTPLPFAYQVHLRMSLWIYLALFPFQIYTLMGWITIPATAFASFLLLGFLEIGQEIENPFNYDLNDLDLDYFCLAIQRDLHEITAHVNHDPSEFLFTKWNQPLAPADRRHAEELIKDLDAPYQSVDGGAEPGIQSIRRTLLKGWKVVDTVTRQ